MGKFVLLTSPDLPSPGTELNSELQPYIGYIAGCGRLGS